MANYFTPGIFIENSPNPPLVETPSNSNGGFVGVAERGTLNAPVFLNSWNDYIKNFALGLDSPFIYNSDLAYAVYGFFQNGGKKCYVLRVASETAKKATVSNETPAFVVNAKDAGTWGNDLKLTITANADIVTNFDIAVTLGTTVVENFVNVTNTAGAENNWMAVLEAKSNFIEGVSGSIGAVAALALATGADGISDIADSDYTDALVKFDAIDDISLLAIPGQTSTTLHTAVMTYCENRGDILALLDAPEVSTVESVLALRKTMSCANGALLFPWIKVSDALSKIGKLKSAPPSGHVMGVYARTITDRGVWKAPAGTEATVRGAVDVTVTLTKADTDALNPAGVIPIMPKTNYGIVVWGARSLHSDATMKYVSDVLLDSYIKKSVYNLTQPFVFEPNSVETWTRIEATVQSFLDTLWRNGGLYGESASEAYFVKCDESLNPQSVRSEGKINCEVGYAGKKPAEFIIFRFSHEMASAN